MGKYIEYTTTIAIKENEYHYSWINLFSKEKMTGEDFFSIVKEVFEENKSDVVVYSISDLLIERKIDKETYECLLEEGDSISNMGENTYPDEYKYVDARKLSELIMKKHPQFIKNLKIDVVRARRIIL